MNHATTRRSTAVACLMATALLGLGACATTGHGGTSGASPTGSPPAGTVSSVSPSVSPLPWGPSTALTAPSGLNSTEPGVTATAVDPVPTGNLPDIPPSDVSPTGNFPTGLPTPTSPPPSVVALPSYPGGTTCPAPQSAWSSRPAAGNTGGHRTIALTFDDGPDRDTAAILDVLASRHVHATFFDIGAHALAHPELVRREAAEGHLIGGHSWAHRYPWQVRGGWTPAFVADQMSATVKLLREQSGQPVCFYRPPGGIMTNMPAQARAHRLQLVLWSIDPKDWAHPQTGFANTPAAQGILARSTQPGTALNPVLLMHDGGGARGASVAALGPIIDWYRAHGYDFVRLDGLT